VTGWGWAWYPVLSRNRVRRGGLNPSLSQKGKPHCVKETGFGSPATASVLFYNSLQFI
ncbi:16881_t:CDS:1, partial [Racocetra persica]